MNIKNYLKYLNDGLRKLEGVLSVNIALTSENHQNNSIKSEKRFKIMLKT